MRETVNECRRQMQNICSVKRVDGRPPERLVVVSQKGKEDRKDMKGARQRDSQEAKKNVWTSDLISLFFIYLSCLVFVLSTFPSVYMFIMPTLAIHILCRHIYHCRLTDG